MSKIYKRDIKKDEYYVVPIEKSGNSDVFIDFDKLVQTFISNWKNIFFISSIASVIGVVIVYLTVAQVFYSNVSLLPEYSKQAGTAGSLLRQFSGALGGSFGSYVENTNALRVEIYPQIVNSLEFQEQLITRPVFYSDSDGIIIKTTLMDYFLETKVNHKGLFSWLSEDDEVVPFKTDSLKGLVQFGGWGETLLKYVANNVSVTLDEDTGIIVIHSYFEDPVLAASVANASFLLLSQSIVQYRLNKLQTDLAFFEEMKKDAQSRYKEAQEKLASFVESNKSITSEFVKIKKTELQGEVTIAMNVYDLLVQKYEETKIKVQEETPVFKVLNEAVVPNKKSFPRLSYFLIAFFVISSALSFAYHVFKKR